MLLQLKYFCTSPPYLDGGQRGLDGGGGGIDGLLDVRSNGLDTLLHNRGGDIVALLEDLDSGVDGGDARLHEVTGGLKGSYRR